MFPLLNEETMIYYNEELIVWKGKKSYTEEEAKVREEIEGSNGIRQKYFGDQTSKLVRIMYPKGKPNPNDGGNGFSQLKIYPVRLKSSDGQWRWSSSRKTNKGFVDHHRNIKHDMVLTEKDIEFLWFLCNRSGDMNKFIFIQDLEGDAQKQIETMATDVDIKYAIMSPRSPLSKDEELIRQVAEILGIRDVANMKFGQVKLALYDKVVEGEKMKDPFCNFEKFDELTQGNTVREQAYNARTAINERIVGYKPRAWYLMAGNEYIEKLMDVKPGESNYREQVFVDEVVKNPNLRERLYSAMGVKEETSLDKLMEMDRPTLQRKLKDEFGEFDNKWTKEEVAKKLCDHYKIKY